MSERKKNKSFPRYAYQILKHFLPDYDFPYIIGVYEKEYSDRKNNRGRNSAWLWIVLQILKACPSFLRLKYGGELMQIYNFIKTTKRNFIRHKLYSLINVSGLTIGFACFIFILLFVHHETNYDSFHQDADRIYRVFTQFSGDASYWGSDETATTAAALAGALQHEFPEVEAATKLKPASHVFIKTKEKGFYEDVILADKDFFKVFSYPFEAGDPHNALVHPESIVLTRRTAEKLFKKENPMGLWVDNLAVTGVMKDIPKHSHLQFEIVVPFVRLFPREHRQERLNNWSDRSYYTYIKLKPGSSPSALEKKLTLIAEKYFNKNNQQFQEMRFYLQPIKKIHVNTQLNGDFPLNNDIRIIYLFSAVAFLVLLIACLNYINLSTAQAAQRAKSIGIRKVVGADRMVLIRHFVGESILYALMSLLFALLLVSAFFPHFSSFLERSMNFSLLSQWRFVVFFVVVALFAGAAAGLYPAFFLASFRPIDVLRGDMRGPGRGQRLRGLLTVFQFCISIILLSSMLIVFKQNRFIKNTDVGYDREHVVVLELDKMQIREDIRPLKNKLLNQARILGVSISSNLPVKVTGADRITIQTEDGENIRFRTNRTTGDESYMDVFGIKIIQGRNFSSAFGTEEERSILVNEAFVEKASWKDPIGKRISHWMAKDGRVIGVIKNFNYRSLHQEILPMLMVYQPRWSAYLSMRISPGPVKPALESIKEIFSSVFPDHPFEYRFLDDVFNSMYRAETKLEKTLGIFTLLAGFIACLGLYGLVSYNLERKTKDIGIRKILGASVPGIIFLFSRDTLKFVLVSCLISWPIVYFVMNRWLQNFAYKTIIGVDVFIVSALLAFVISLATVGLRSIRAASANPVDSLRYE
jgi:putative ABC transport system permease protein